MRILVSGSHSLGKSTFVHDFIKAFPEYKREEEPYRALSSFHDIKFGKEATCFCNSLQTYYCISRLKQYTSASDCVIFDRAPTDYLPYSMYPAKYGQTDINDQYVRYLLEPIRESLSFADYIIFIPITNKHLVEIEDDGIRPIDADYRQEVDAYFKQLYREELFNLFPQQNGPKLIELWGTRKKRVQKIAQLLNL